MELDDVIAELIRLRDTAPSTPRLCLRDSDGRYQSIQAIDVDKDGDIIIHID